MRSSKLVVSPPVGEPVQRRRGRPPLPVVVHPDALWEVHDDPRDFHAALDLQIRRHGENSHRLHRAIVVAGGLTDRTTLAAWRRGLKVPQTPASLKVLDIIEHRYQLEAGYLRSRLQRRRALSGLVPPEVQYAESRRLAWHLPDDFDERSAEEREEILAWVRSTILSGGTAYHRYHSTVSKHRFALRFDGSGPSDLAAPAQLRSEMDALLRFKSATLTDIGYQRSGVWGAETAAQREEHLALLFGALGATELDRVAQMTPGLVIQLQDRLLPGISLRGITSDDTSPAAEPRVALFQDGVPITQIASAYGEMFDVDRVEVEKGPQSTLHGRSALNGGISIFQKMPGDTLGLEAKAGVGDHGQRLLQAVVNIPVSDSFGLRFGALKRQRDGFLEDTKGGTYNSVDGQAYRLTARYMPNDVFSFRFAGTYDVDDTDSGGAFKSNVFAPRNQQTGAVEGDVRFWTPTHLGTFGDLAQAYSRREIVGLSGTSDLTLSDRLDLTAISGYRWYTACQAGDIDGTPTNIIAYDLCNDGEQFSQELRLNIRRSGPFEGFVGASYFTASNAQTTDLGADERAMALLLSGVLHRYAPNGLTNNQINAALGTAAANYKPFHLDRRRQTADIETYDLFADGTFHLSDRLQAFVGGRLTWDDKTVSMQVSTPSGVSRLTGAALLMTLTPGGAAVRGSHSSNLTTGRAGVRYELTPDVNVYAVYGVGKRPEVIDLDPSGAARILPAEELASAEVGVKYRLFDGALFGDASVYRFDYSNFQTFQRNGDRLEPVNAGAAEATGFETQATWRLADGLSVFGSYAYNHARFSGGAYDGNRFRSSPDDKFAFGVNAVIPTRLGELAITPVYSWQSKIFFSDDNDRADLQVRSRPAFSDKAVDEFQDAFGLFNLRLNLTPERGPWSFTVFGENLLDEKYVVDAGNTGDSFGMPTFIVGSRRNVRFEVSAKF